MRKLKGLTGNNRVLSSIVTLLVIGLIVLVGPVDALYLKLDGFKTTPYSFGEVINFIGKIEINKDEIVDMQNVSIEVNDEIVCTFDLDGNKLSDCTGVNVSLILNSVNHGYGYGYNNFNKGWNGGNNSSNAGNWTGYKYGYGYGYNNGGLAYNISMQTPQDYFRIHGNNEIKLVSQTETQTFNSRTEHIVIQPQNSGGTGGGNNGGGSGDDGGRRNNKNNNFNNLALNGENDANNLLQALSGSGGQGNTNLLTGAAVGTSNKIGALAIMGVALFLFLIATASIIVYKRRKRFT